MRIKKLFAGWALEKVRSNWRLAEPLRPSEKSKSQSVKEHPSSLTADGHWRMLATKTSCMIHFTVTKSPLCPLWMCTMFRPPTEPLGTTSPHFFVRLRDTNLSQNLTFISTWVCIVLVVCFDVLVIFMCSFHLVWIQEKLIQKPLQDPSQFNPVTNSCHTLQKVTDLSWMHWKRRDLW